MVFINFDKDYAEFIEDLKKKHTPLASPVLCRLERVAVCLFVAYLNHKYASECAEGGEHE